MLVLLAQGDVLPLDSLQVLNPHLQLMLMVLKLALVVLAHDLHLFLQLLLVARSTHRAAVLALTLR